MRTTIAFCCLLAAGPALAADDVCTRIKTSQAPFQITLHPHPTAVPGAAATIAEVQVFRSGGRSDVHIGAVKGTTTTIVGRYRYENGLVTQSSVEIPVKVDMTRSLDKPVAKDAIANHDSFEVAGSFRVERANGATTNSNEDRYHAHYRFVRENTATLADCALKVAAYDVESTQDRQPAKVRTDKAEFLTEIGIPWGLLQPVLSQAETVTIETTFTPLVK